MGATGAVTLGARLAISASSAASASANSSGSGAVSTGTAAIGAAAAVVSGKLGAGAGVASGPSDWAVWLAVPPPKIRAIGLSGKNTTDQIAIKTSKISKTTVNTKPMRSDGPAGWLGLRAKSPAAKALSAPLAAVFDVLRPVAVGSVSRAAVCGCAVSL